MKKTIIFLLLVMSYLSQAQESESTSEMGKLSYLPPKDSSILEIGLGYNLISSKLTGPAGTVADLKNTSTSAGFSFGYGVDKDLTVGLQGSYLGSSVNDYSYGPGSTVNGTTASTKTEGLRDPLIGFFWRAKDNVETGIRVHLSAGISPKIADAKSATATDKGNASRGGDAIQVMLEFYKQTDALEFGLVLNRTQSGKSKSTDATNSAKTYEGSESGTTSVKLVGQKKTSSDLYLGGMLNIDMFDESSTETFTNGVRTSKTQSDSGRLTVIGVEAKLLLDQKSFVRIGVESLVSGSSSATIGTTKVNQSFDSGSNSIKIGWAQEF